MVASPPRRARRSQPPAWLAPLLLGCATLAQAAPAQLTELTTMSLEDLLDVPVVGASKYEQKASHVAAAVTVITRQEIRAFGWRTLDEALASLPGVHRTQDRQYTYLGMRGFGLPGDAGTRLLATIDGNRVNEPLFDTGPGGREFPLDLDLVERIEFIPGPGGAVYGQNAMFGVVNIVTRRGAEIGGTELAVARQTRQRLTEGRASWGGLLDGGVDLVLSVQALRARGQDLAFDYGASGVSGTAVGLDGERDREFFVRAARGAWALSALQGDRRKDDPTGMFFSDPLTPGQYQRDRYRLAQLEYQSGPDGGRLDVLGRLHAGAYDYDNPLVYGRSRFSYPAASRWHGAELRLVSTEWGTHKAMVGFEWQTHERQDLSMLDLGQPANDVAIPGSGYRASGYAQDEWQLTPTLATTLGLRVDRNDVTGTHASPRAALIWQAGAATTLKTLYGRAHRAPNVGERDYDDGVSQIANPALKGERIDTLEFVVDHRAGPDLSLHGAAYHWRMRDLITLGIDTASGLAQFRSGRTVEARGAEFAVHRAWPHGVRLRASVALQDVAYAGGGAPPNSPRVLGKANLAVPLPWAGLRVGYEWMCDGPRTAVDGRRLGGHAVSNLTLGGDTVAPGLRLTLVLRNLLDKRYAHAAADVSWQTAFDQDHRSAVLRAEYRF